MAMNERPLPDETLNGLSPPLAGFPYFAHAEALPFEPGSTAYSAVNAWWLADAAFLAYGSASFVDSAFRASPLPCLGFRLGRLGSEAEARGLVLERDDLCLIAFTGTRLKVHTLMDVIDVAVLNQNDLWLDAQFLPEAHRAGGKVHSGFLRAFRQISEPFDRVCQSRRPGQALWLTGHSLGGAMACLVAAQLGAANVAGLYTFGSPRVGDAAFCQGLPKQSHHRFVHRDDPVPNLPPELLGYVHAGELHRLIDGPPRNPWEDVARSAREFGSTLWKLTSGEGVKTGDLPVALSGLADHMPVYYATLLWNALLKP